MSYFTLKNGMKLYYEDTGSGQTIIMMHGWTANHEIYQEPARLLSSKARCIIYDHRGHGGSKNANQEAVTMETLASDLNELIQGLHLTDVILVGWSMGAGTALTYVRDYGCSALKQLVLVDMSPRQLNDATWKLGLGAGKYTAADMKRDETRSFLRVYQDFITATIPKYKKVPGFLLRPGLKKQLANCDETVLKSLASSMKAQDLREVAGKIDVPFTYFYPQPGSLFSPMLADWYRTHTNAPFRMVAFPNSTHMLIAEHPEMFAQEMEKVLASL